MATSLLGASTFAYPVKVPPGTTRAQRTDLLKLCGSGVSGLVRSRLHLTDRRPVHSLPLSSKRFTTPILRGRSALLCAAALNARCGAAETQTVEMPTSTVTVAPSRPEIETPPQLDDGGTGFPPRDDDGDGGGGGGGGGGWKGGFFFFGFLAFLGFLKDQESDGAYQDHRQG